MTKETLLYILMVKKGYTLALSTIKLQPNNEIERYAGMHHAYARIYEICDRVLEEGYIKSPFVHYLISDFTGDLWAMDNLDALDGPWIQRDGKRYAYNDIIQLLEEL